MFKQTTLNEFAFPIHTQEHNHNTRHRDLLLVPQHRTTLVANSFIVQAIRVWNNLPQHLKLSNNIKIFKKKLVEYLQ